MNFITVVILIALLAAFVGAVFCIRQNKGKCGGCGGDCAHCKKHLTNDKNI